MVAKISIFGGMLEIPDFFFGGGGGEGGRTVDAWPEPTYEEKNESTPPPPFNTPMINWCNAQLQLHKII